MQLRCTTCGKTVSSHVHEDTVVRAALICPECIEADRVTFPEQEDDDALREEE